MSRTKLTNVFIGMILAALALWALYRSGGRTNSWPLVNAEQQGRVVVAFGDSLTQGQGASRGHGYPETLATLASLEVRNLGRPGDTTASALARIADVTKLKPNYVLITLGGNDLLTQTPLDEQLSRLGEIFTRLQEAGALVVYLSIAPPTVGDNWAMALRDLCREKGVLWVDDVMAGLWGDSALMSDSIHPSDAGYRKIAERAHAALAPHL